MFVVPAETINLDACSKDTSKKIRSFLGTINKKPLVGLGVVGTKTLIISSLTLFLIKPSFSFVAKPTAHKPFLGYSSKTTLFCLLSDFVKLSVICPIAEYIVLNMGILFNVSLTNCKIFFPIKDRDNQPITVINMIDNNISRPGIEKGK